MSTMILNSEKQAKVVSAPKVLMAAIVAIVMALAMAVIPQVGAKAVGLQSVDSDNFYGVQIEDNPDGSFTMTAGGTTTTVSINDETQVMTVISEDGTIETVDLEELAGGTPSPGLGGLAAAKADSNIVCSVILYAVSALRTYGLAAMIASLVAAGPAGAVALAVVYAVGTEGFLIWVGTKC